MGKLTGIAVVAQGGGPTAVINQSLAGVIEEAHKHDSIQRIYGALHGIEGIVNENFVDLTYCTKGSLESVAATPSSALLSTRVKPDEEYCRKIFEVFKAHNVRYFYYCGGNDSADTCRIVNENAQREGYELRVVHLPKTIDNDLRVTDHSPGYGSAARFVAGAFAGASLDNRALGGVYIGVVMGRDAGFLVASAALAHKYLDDGPHLIYIPEVSFSEEKFLSDVDAVYKNYGRCVIAVSEGIKNSDGESIVTTLQDSVEKDAHGNVQLSGTGALGDALSQLIKSKLNIKRVRADTFGYLQRSFLGTVSQIDAKEAREVGRKAVLFSVWDDRDGSVAIKRTGDYAVSYELVPLENVARKTKSFPENYYDNEKSMVTKDFINYASPIVGALPVFKRIDAPAVNKILNI